MNASSERQHVLDYLHTQFDGTSYCVNPLGTTHLHSYGTQMLHLHEHHSYRTVVYIDEIVKEMWKNRHLFGFISFRWK